METRKVATRLLTAVALAAGAVSVSAQTWNHVPIGDPIGVNAWGGLVPAFATCGTSLAGEVGKKQSPVDIERASAVRTPRLPELSFRYLDTEAVVENTGHVVEVPYAPGSSIRIGSEPQDVYELKQFHFHTPSEHSINGQLAAAEVHLVHANNLLDLTVVGVLINVGYPVNETVDRILKAEFHGHPEVHLDGHVNAKNILPERRSYFHYSGSLTTPPCSEGVRWFVLKRPINVSQEAINNLKAIVRNFPNYMNFQQNNRPVTPLNGRAILKTNQDD